MSVVGSPSRHDGRPPTAAEAATAAVADADEEDMAVEERFIAEEADEFTAPGAPFP